LIEQRLKEMVIGLVDEDNINRRTTEGFRGCQTSKPSADDHQTPHGRAL
jgi:hypothetical protein